MVSCRFLNKNGSQGNVFSRDYAFLLVFAFVILLSYAFIVSADDVQPASVATGDLIVIPISECVENSDCTNPPDSQCYESEGICSDGTCTYTFSDTESPVISNLFANPNLTNRFSNLGAHAEDTCSKISRAYYYIDNACVNKPDGMLNALDGAFDQKIEDLIKNNADFSAFADGRHDVYMRAYDENDNPSDCAHTILNIDKVAPDNPKCHEGGAYGMELNEECSPEELLVCGNNPDLSAYICDTQSRLQAAEYFVDNFGLPNWQGIFMQATDGAFDENCEDVQGTIDISQLAEGTHYVKLHGKDRAENWGKIDEFDPISFIKDTKAPNTTKKLSPNGVFATCYIGSANGNQLTDGCYYVNKGTNITLSAIDPDTEDHEIAGNPAVNYKIWYSNDCLAQEPSWEILSSGVGNPNQAVNLTLTQDSCHLIEYWASDLCGNSEVHHFELDVVDSQAPNISKTVGEPKIVKEDGIYITQQTPITLTCTDVQPHPVGGVSLWYRYRVNDNCSNIEQSEWNDWINTSDGNTVSKMITFPEDSCHQIQYYCVDILGNSNGSAESPLSEMDIVDTQAPISNSSIIGPSYSDGEKIYLDGITQISLSCQDQQPHPVGGEQIYYRYGVDEPSYGVWINYTGAFNFPEESHHYLQYYCTDALENAELMHNEEYYVDHTKPETTKSYGLPSVSGDLSDWITSQTPISLEASDPDTTEYQCNSGVSSTYYRITMVNDSYCRKSMSYEEKETAQIEDSCKNAVGRGEWNEYGGSFNIPEDSCHLIEYYSIDNVNKTEDTKKQCIFVDNSAPNLTKTIGEPKYVNSNNNTYISQQTPITFTCTDAQPHPVGNVTIHVESYWVGQKKPLHIWENNSEILTITNPEDSLHKFKYWCADALGNNISAEEIDNVDTHGPDITIHNPTLYEANNIKRCDQSVVVEVKDVKSGVNNSSIYAELWSCEPTDLADKCVNTALCPPPQECNGQLVRNITLKKAIYPGLHGGEIYEGLMDKQLPAGKYTLKVYALDNLGNVGKETINENLKSGLYVEYITSNSTSNPNSCVVSILNGGNCDFIFHVCMRDRNGVQFWLDKLGENPALITPDMMNATISKNGNSTYVGLMDVSQAGQLILNSTNKINGKTTFDLNLYLSSNITSIIGTGIQDLDYKIKSFDP